MIVDPRSMRVAPHSRARAPATRSSTLPIPLKLAAIRARGAMGARRRAAADRRPMIPPGRSAYVKSDFLGPLDDDALQILGRHHAEATSPHCQILLHQMGGAFTAEPAGGTAFPNRDASWMVTIAAIWTDPSEAAAPHVEWARSLWREFRPWSTGTYVNHLGDEGAERVREAYGASYSRLVALKQHWVPENVFRLNQDIVPPTTVAG